MDTAPRGSGRVPPWPSPAPACRWQGALVDSGALALDSWQGVLLSAGFGALLVGYGSAGVVRARPVRFVLACVVVRILGGLAAPQSDGMDARLDVAAP